MGNELKEWVEKLFSNYKPLSNIDRQLIGKPNKDDFKNFVEAQVVDVESGLKQRIMDELFDWGPLKPLKTKEDVFDILLQGYNEIYFEDPKGLQPLKDHFASPTTYQNFIQRICNQANILTNQKDPFGNGQVEGFRIHIAIPPITKSPTLTLRKHRKKIFPLQHLEKTEFLSSQQKEWLQKIINGKKSFLIVGPTGSGKTTFLNALLAEIKHPERNVIIEDTDEIKNDNPLTCKMLAREICPESLSPITMTDLVKQSLRMRPDRIIVGEVRGAEAKDLLQALATGHSGSMGTIHASSGQQALLRLEMLIQMGAPEWSLHSIRQLIQLSLDYLIVLKEDRQQKGIFEICKVSSLESFGLLLEPVNFGKNQSSFKPVQPFGFG